MTTTTATGTITATTAAGYQQHGLETRHVSSCRLLVSFFLFCFYHTNVYFRPVQHVETAQQQQPRQQQSLRLMVSHPRVLFLMLYLFFLLGFLTTTTTATGTITATAAAGYQQHGLET
jgi:Na+/melibiose symporter-like transporter